jgi:hypothetical protein
MALPVDSNHFRQRIHTKRERLSMVDLFVKIACFVKKEKYYIFSVRISWSEILSKRRSTVQSFPFIKDSLLQGKQG